MSCTANPCYCGVLGGYIAKGVAAIDLAGASLATHEPARVPSELRAISEEMRKRLIQSTRLHHAALEARQEKARTVRVPLREFARDPDAALEKALRTG